MHPLNFEVVVKTQQLEIERAVRRYPEADGWLSEPSIDPPRPSRFGLLRFRLSRLMGNPAFRKVHAD